MMAPTKPQAQLCSEACETIYQQGVAHFHLIESSCFSLRNSEALPGARLS